MEGFNQAVLEMLEEIQQVVMECVAEARAKWSVLVWSQGVQNFDPRAKIIKNTNEVFYLTLGVEVNSSYC
jgi:citrate synthase